MTISFGMILFSCDSDKEPVPAKEENAGKELTVVSRATDTTITDPTQPNHPDHPDYWPTKPPVSTGETETPPYEGPYNRENIVFTGEDIASFHITTREITFTHPSTADNLNKRTVGLFIKLAFYLNETPLLVADVYSPIAGFFYNDLVFVIEDSGFYLLDGYPRGRWEGDAAGEITDAIREANAQKRKNEWDTFIKYLTEAGKIVR
ncbi:MAG: hypothetical protein LBB84_00795 [Tannerellaceae bacterium]|nr:hypothetical protein [Tannerellaceae bacterium]